MFVFLVFNGLGDARRSYIEAGAKDEYHKKNLFRVKKYVKSSGC
jgi:hypothetical protein